MKLAHRWAWQAEVPMRRSSRLTAVHKDEEWGRLITGQEGRESQQVVAPDWVFTDVAISEQEELRFYGADSRDMKEQRQTA